MIARLEKLFLVLDALGLVAFAVIGAEVARAQGLGVVLVVSSGVITAVFGGVLRDIFCGIVPLVFRKELYAGVAILTSLLYYWLCIAGLEAEVASIIAVACGFIIRIWAIWYNISVPVFSYGDRSDGDNKTQQNNT